MSPEEMSKIFLLLNEMNQVVELSSAVVVNVACLVAADIKARQARIKRLHRILHMRHRNRLNRNVWVQFKSGVFWERDAVNFDESTFKEHFRMSRSSFAKVVQAVRCLERQDTAYRQAIPLGKRVAIALYALGSSAEYRTIALIFGVGRTTVGEIVLEFCCVLYTQWHPVYLNAYPMTQARMQEIILGFEELGYPQCIGAIDGTHIEISPRKREAADYFNYKGWYSMILFAAVDHRYRFTYINVGLPGRNSDSFAYNMSALKWYTENNNMLQMNAKSIGGVQVPVHLIGDSAFKLSETLMKPYSFGIDQPRQEKLFNYRLSKCRRVVENAFGHLKRRFRRVGQGLEVRIENAPKIVKACCVLHNFLCNERDAISEHWRENNSTRQQPLQQSRGNDANAGRIIRDAIAKHFFETDAPLHDVDGGGEVELDVPVAGVGGAEVDAAEAGDVH